MKKVLLLLLILPLLVAFSLPTPVMAKTKWDLEGWRHDQGKWMDGLLWTYYECSWVPYRLGTTCYDGADNISIQHDYLDGKGNFGFDDAQNFFIGPQTVREQSPYPVGNIPILVDEFAGIFHIEGPNPVEISNGKIIEYNIIIDNPAELVAAAGVDFAIYWEAHCSKTGTMGGVGDYIEYGSSYWNGASLHTHTSVTGNQDVPIKTPRRQTQTWDVVAVAFEDLPLGAGNNWDYNDWVTDFGMVATYDDNELAQLEFTFVSQASGAGYNHDQHLFFPGGTFDSSGSYSVSRYDKDGVLISSASGPFDSEADLDLLVFISTQDVLPANSGTFANTVDGSGTSVGGYTDVLIEFNNPFEFTVPDIEAIGVHGEGLFFDPYLYVYNTLEEIHTGDDRTLVVPDDWQWPQENAHIGMVYTGVTTDSPPNFTDTDWYTNTPNDYIWDPVTVAP